MDVESRYALTSDGVCIAYQTAGAGPVDLVWQPDWPGLERSVYDSRDARDMAARLRAKRPVTR